MPLGNLLHSMLEVFIISVNKKRLQLNEILNNYMEGSGSARIK